MHPWLKLLIMFAVLVALTVLAPFAGFAIGTAAIALFGLTGIPAAAIVTVALVGGTVLGIKAAQWLIDLPRRRT